MYFSSKDGNFNLDLPKKHVRFNSSELSSPSDVQTPRPLGEIQNLSVTKQKLFSNTIHNVKNSTSVTKNILINDIPYLPPRFSELTSKCSDENFLTPKPSSDLELSVFDSPSLIENSRNVNDVLLEKKLLENDSPYSFSPRKMPIRNILKPMEIPADLVDSSTEAKKKYKCNDSTLDFFTQPLKKAPEYSDLPATIENKRLPKNNNPVTHVTQKQNQTINSGIQCHNRMKKYRNESNCCRNRDRILKCESQYCECIPNINRNVNVEKHKQIIMCCKNHKPDEQSQHDYQYETLTTQRIAGCCDCNAGTREKVVDPVEIKRQAIMDKYKDKNHSNDLATVRDDYAEPTVLDLYKIIKAQNDQLQTLQKQFAEYVAEKNKEPTQNTQQYHYNNMNCVEHISIGVMTSFEMIRSSNYVGTQNVAVDNYVQTSTVQDRQTNAESKSHQKKNDDCNLLNTDSKNVGIPPQSHDGKGPECGRNFLDGIHRVNNVPSPKYSSGQALHRIVEENHSDDQNIETTVTDAMCAHNDTGNKNNKSENNEGWTFYNKVVNRVNNILNSPPSNGDKEKTSPKLVDVQRINREVMEDDQNCNRPKVSYKAYIPQMQVPTKSPPPMFVELERPISELSLHMKQLASKYNIPNSNMRNQPQPRRIIDTMKQAGGILGQHNDGRNVLYCIDGQNVTMQNNYNVVQQNKVANNYMNYGLFSNFADNATPVGVMNEQMYCGVAGDMSFATMQYMHKYQLLAVTNEHPSPAPIATTPNRPLPPAYQNSSRILDITALKQQPKLL